MKNWVKRALWTFGQAAIGYILVGVPAVDFTAEWSAVKTALIGVGVSAVAAGLAAVKNYIQDKKEE